MPGPDGPTAAWLTSDAGLTAVAQATAALDAGEDELRVAARLTGLVRDPGRRASVLDAAVCRRRARARWPDADRMLFTREALEQASDPVVAAHRSGSLLARAAGEGGRWDGTVLDLAAGVGGDAIALARTAAAVGGEVTAVDTDPARLRLLAHNAEVAGVRVHTRCADALTVVSSPATVCHADPGRRVGQRRVRRLSEHQPSVPALLAAHADALHLAVALSPGVEPEDPDLPAGLEVEYVQLDGALVEATLWVPGPDGGPALAGAGAPSGDGGPGTPQAVRRATLLAGDGTEVARLPAVGDGEPPAPPDELAVGEIGAWLVEVAPAAVRARQHDALGAAIGAWRVARNRALLTCDTAPPASPWYRAWPVVAVLPGRAKAVRRWLRDAGRARQGEAAGEAGAAAEAGPSGQVDHLAGGVEVVLHGVDADPTRLWQELGRPPRGPHGIRLVFLRRDHDTVAVVCAAVAGERRGTMGA